MVVFVSSFFFFFFLFFFESYQYCLMYKILHAARAMAEKNLQYPWEMANPPCPCGVEPIAYPASNKKPLTC